MDTKFIGHSSELMGMGTQRGQSQDEKRVLFDCAVLCLEAKATVNRQNQNGESPLILAAMRGNNDFVSTLIDHNADVNITDNAQHTALYYAAESGFTEIVEILIMAGAEGN